MANETNLAPCYADLALSVVDCNPNVVLAETGVAERALHIGGASTAGRSLSTPNPDMQSKAIAREKHTDAQRDHDVMVARL